MAKVGLKTLEKFNAPGILFANTYNWRPAASSEGRRDNERKRIHEVFSWLSLINEILGLDLQINKWDTGVEAYQGKEEIFVFTYSESARHVYKHQKVMPLAKILSKIEEDEYLLNFLKIALAYRPLKGRKVEEKYQKYKEIVKFLIGERLEKVKEVLSEWAEELESKSVQDFLAHQAVQNLPQISL